MRKSIRLPTSSFSSRLLPPPLQSFLMWAISSGTDPTSRLSELLVFCYVQFLDVQLEALRLMQAEGL